MPETPISQRGKGRYPYRPVSQKASQRATDSGDVKKKKAGRGDAIQLNPVDDDHDDDVTADEQQDPQDKLCQSLKDQLTDCSSQRLRCLHMTLRRLANVDNTISDRDLQLAFQENQVNVTSRLYQMLCELYSGAQGIDYERLYKCLVTAHGLTDRDSVRARRKRNDVTSRPQMSQEKRDADFLSRIASQLVRDQTFFDIDMLRDSFQTADTHRTGNIDTSKMMTMCAEKTPLYGALLENLLRRCDEDRNNTVSWPTLLSFLERGQTAARQQDPELHLLPEKARATAAVNVAPDPINELSSGTKARLVSKLMRKASARSGGTRAGSSLSNAPSVTSPISSRNTSPDPAGKTETNDSTTENKERVPVVSFQNSTAKEEERAEDVAPDNGVQTDKQGSKKKEADDKHDVKVTSAGPAPKEVPVIEVDKASETDHSSNDDTRDTTSTTVTSSSTTKDTTSATTTTATTTVTTTTTSHSETDGDDREGEEVKTKGGKVVTVAGRDVQVTVPTDFSPPDTPGDPPSQRLQLDWVYGCRGNDCRRSVQVLGSGELVYFISTVCVLLERSSNAQRHYREHTEDIKSMAVHSNGVVVATGQFASKIRPDNVAHIRVWRSDLLQTTHVLGAGTFTKAVMCLAFVPDKDVLAAVDNSPDKRVTVWDLATHTTLADGYCRTETVCDIEFNPKHPDLLVTCGKEHLQWWKLYLDTGSLQPSALPDYESYLKAKFVVCCAHTDKGDLITGDSNGTVYIWGGAGNRITNFVKHGHDGPVLSVLFYKGYLLSGGRDGHVTAWTWDKNMDKAASVQIPVSEGGVRGLLVSGCSLILCTTVNSMLSITLASLPCPLEQAALDPVPITQGHYDELRAVTVIKESFLGADILTAGSDGMLCKFASTAHAPVWKLFVKGMQYLCVDCSSAGDVIVLGTRDGRVIQLEIDRDTLQVLELLNNKVTTSGILCIALAPDKVWLAAGGEDGGIYVFRLADQEEEGGADTWNLWGILKGHRGQVVSLDWTRQPHTDGVCLLRSASSAPQQKFWNVHSCTEVDGSQLTTLAWNTNTCTLDHLLTGVWNSKQAERAKLKAVDVNQDRSLVAMGNSVGVLSLFRYPCDKDLVYSHTYHGHQTIQGLRFTPSGLHVVTVGGQDSALLQWRVI